MVELNRIVVSMERGSRMAGFFMFLHWRCAEFAASRSNSNGHSPEMFPRGFPRQNWPPADAWIYDAETSAARISTQKLKFSQPLSFFSHSARVGTAPAHATWATISHSCQSTFDVETQPWKHEMSAQVPKGHRHPKSNSWGCWNMANFTWIYHDLARIYPQLMAENGKLMFFFQWTFWGEPRGSSSGWALHSLGRGRHTSPGWIQFQPGHNVTQKSHSGTRAGLWFWEIQVDIWTFCHWIPNEFQNLVIVHGWNIFG